MTFMHTAKRDWQISTSCYRFWRKTTQDGECWIWAGVVMRDGYGQVTWNRKTMRAHRVAWALSRGEVPPGMQVLHVCDRPLCVNPAHLFLGTHADNMADKVAKGRQYRPAGDKHWVRKRPEAMATGERHPNHRLTADEVDEIRRAAATNSQADLARRYGVSASCINKIVLGKMWRRQ